MTFLDILSTIFLWVLGIQVIVFFTASMFLISIEILDRYQSKIKKEKK